MISSQRPLPQNTGGMWYDESANVNVGGVPAGGVGTVHSDANPHITIILLSSTVLRSCGPFILTVLQQYGSMPILLVQQHSTPVV